MKNKVYKIIIVVVMLSVLLSSACVNASAFENVEGGYVDIYGDQDSDNANGSIYGDGYALINCGCVCDMDLPYYVNSGFGRLNDLDDFLESLEYGTFVSPNGLYDSGDYDTLKYLEVFALCNGKLASYGVVPVGLRASYFLGHAYYLKEIIPGVSYEFNADWSVKDSCYFSPPGFHYSIVVACYFDDFSPYDELRPMPELIADKESLKESFDSCEAERRDLIQQVTDLEIVYEQRVADLRREIFDLRNNADIPDLFTGISDSLLTFVLGIGGLGFTTPNGVSITISSLITLAVLGAFLVFILRMIFGGGKS